MGKVFEKIDAKVKQFIEQQKVFFVATAPQSSAGHLNLSPKGLDCFSVLGEHSVAYGDCNGSGVETIAHLKENGRIVLMFCAFEGAPKIVRLHGRGEVIEPHHIGFEELRSQLPGQQKLRSIIRVQCDRISDSCGFGVPVMAFQKHRTQLDDWAAQKDDAALRDYQKAKNAVSIDGIPGLDFPPAE